MQFRCEELLRVNENVEENKLAMICMKRKRSINRLVYEAEVGLSHKSSSVYIIHSLIIIILLHFCQNGGIDQRLQSKAASASYTTLNTVNIYKQCVEQKKKKHDQK